MRWKKNNQAKYFIAANANLSRESFWIKDWGEVGALYIAKFGCFILLLC
jgi:hypothetical protein